MELTYRVILDAEVADAFAPSSPFSLKKDLKEFRLKEQKDLANAIIDLLVLGPDRPSYAILTDRKVSVWAAKLRIPVNSSSKRDGIRVYVLVDSFERLGIVLGISRHSKNENDLTDYAKKWLAELVDCYIEQKKEEK